MKFNYRNSRMFCLTGLIITMLFLFILYKIEYDGMLLIFLKFNLLISAFFSFPIVYLFMKDGFKLNGKGVYNASYCLISVFLFSSFSHMFAKEYELPILNSKEYRFIKNIYEYKNDYNYDKKFLIETESDFYSYSKKIFSGNMIIVKSKSSHDGLVQKTYLCDNEGCIKALKVNEEQKNKYIKIS